MTDAPAEARLKAFVSTHKTILATCAILASVAGGGAAIGPHVADMWNTPTTITELKQTTDDLKKSVDELRVQIKESSLIVDASPCAEYPSWGQSMSDAAAGGIGKISLSIDRLRDDCEVLLPIRVYLIDSAGVSHDASSNFGGKDLKVGIQKLSYYINIPSEVALGIATIFVEVRYDIPGGQKLLSPGIPFTVKSDD